MSLREEDHYVKRREKYARRRSAGICSCGKMAVNGLARCQDCRERINLLSRQRYTPARTEARKVYERIRRERLINSGVCTSCAQKPALPGDRRCEACIDRKRRLSREHLKRLKDAAFAAYGGYRCACCGETEALFLSIDHIKNDGAKHRRELKEGGGNIHRWLKENGYPPGFQILCFNCNCGKRMNGGVCPHKKAA